MLLQKALSFCCTPCLLTLAVRKATSSQPVSFTVWTLHIVSQKQQPDLSLTSIAYKFNLKAFCLVFFGVVFVVLFKVDLHAFRPCSLPLVAIGPS